MTPLLGVGACVSIQFGVVEAVKRYFDEVNQKKGLKGGLSNAQLYQAGAAAGLANAFVAGECPCLCLDRPASHQHLFATFSGPVEQIRIRLQTQKNRTFAGPLDCAQK